MRPIPFGELLRRMFEEYRREGSIFGIPKALFFRKRSPTRVQVFGESCDLPLGPAAGPHTQLAQNLVAGYLAGGRFFELKTVQKLDRLEVSKPCIDAEDECYNCEWSTEFTLEKAYDEYVKAWVLLHVLEEVFSLRTTDARSFIFNMSVGYELEGIRTPRMDAYLRKMLDSSEEPEFRNYLAVVDSLTDDPRFLAGTDLAWRREALRGLSSRISPVLSPSVTLSTMHGCPPDEIEAICRYLLTEKGTDTFVKLNPTLLGYERVRGILDGLGFRYVPLAEASFDKDLQYGEALAMLWALRDVAAGARRGFGVKLTNTLGSQNYKGWLPDKEMYLSGRALFPLSISLALDLSRACDGNLPISYSGGAAQWNLARILATGIRPVTLATDLLKPGGYLRMAELARIADEGAGRAPGKIDVAALAKLADEAVGGLPETRKEWRPRGSASIPRKLPLLDCYAAPCTFACPIGQDVPEYVRLVGERRYEEALRVVCTKNALPAITGHICDHQCMAHCTRLDYESPVEIRELKRIAAERGAGYRAEAEKSVPKQGARVAIVGAGPTGLAAAYFLAREGFPVTVFERRETAGGVVRHVIPEFRIPEDAIEADVRYVEAHAVEFRFSQTGPLTVEKLQEEGFRYVFLAFGAEAGAPLGLASGGEKVVRALDFLEGFRRDPKEPKLGPRVVVVGGGNTAMDTARAALRVEGVESVTVLYRRTQEEMPAAPEEIEEARREGVRFAFLTSPESLGQGALLCRKMALGEPDESGRRAPLPTDETELLAADTVLAAIGEAPEREALAAFGLVLDESGRTVADRETGETGREGVFLGGDVRTGPSTVVRCIAEARKVADAICRKELSRPSARESASARIEPEERRDAIARKKGRVWGPVDLSAFGEEAFAAREAERCLECNAVCEKCVDVCPNRANVAVRVDGRRQILHLDALCNECGNCARFCPYAVDGAPYREKLTVFSRAEDFATSGNSGFFVEGSDVRLRLDGESLAGKLEEGRVLPNGALPTEIQRVIETVCREYPYLLGPVGE